MQIGSAPIGALLFLYLPKVYICAYRNALSAQLIKHCIYENFKNLKLGHSGIMHDGV